MVEARLEIAQLTPVNWRVSHSHVGSSVRPETYSSFLHCECQTSYHSFDFQSVWTRSGAPLADSPRVGLISSTVSRPLHPVRHTVHGVASDRSPAIQDYELEVQSNVSSMARETTENFGGDRRTNLLSVFVARWFHPSIHHVFDHIDS